MGMNECRIEAEMRWYINGGWFVVWCVVKVGRRGLSGL